MISKWDKEVLIKEIQTDINPDPSELIDLINNNDLNPEVKMILISEYYDPEVIITAEWLTNHYGLDITAFAVSIHKLSDQLFVHFDQRFPLKELSDVYEERWKKPRSTAAKETLTWNDVLPKLKYSFAAKAIELVTKVKIGDPSRRRIIGVRTNFDGFENISIYYRLKYLNIGIRGKYEGAESHLKSLFSIDTEILYWEHGYSFNIDDEKRFGELVKWLKL